MKEPILEEMLVVSGGFANITPLTKSAPPSPGNGLRQI